MSFADLAHEFRLALRSAGYAEKTSLLSPRATVYRSHTPEAFETFARLPQAHLVCAVIETFAHISGLRDVEDFSVSCLPRTGGPDPNLLRASAVSVGGVEVLVVLIERQSGRLASIVVWGESDEDTSWLSDFPKVAPRRSHLDGGGIEVQVPRDSVEVVMGNPAFSSMVRRRLSRMRQRANRYRRDDWHNKRLWTFMSRGVTEPATVFGDDEEWDVTSDDAMRLVRQRTSQLRFRNKLLSRPPVECAICGITERSVLEAAHLIPHARGGKASSDNGRLLCANHHRAFDAGLYRWTGSEFEWSGDGHEPMLGGERPPI